MGLPQNQDHRLESRAMEQTPDIEPSPLYASLDAAVREHGPIRAVLPFIGRGNDEPRVGAMLYFHDSFQGVFPVDDVHDIKTLVGIVQQRYLGGKPS